MKVRENYIVFKGDNIVYSTESLEKAKEKFDKLLPRQKILDGRAIYKLIKEDK